MHHELIGKKHGYVVDHINGNGLDNQSCNLRHVTNRQNQQNMHITKSSKYPGVCWDTAAKRWASRIKINGSFKWLGRYDSEHEAFAAYRSKHKEITDDDILLPL